jgi:hypothetical protein
VALVVRLTALPLSEANPSTIIAKIVSSISAVNTRLTNSPVLMPRWLINVSDSTNPMATNLMVRLSSNGRPSTRTSAQPAGPMAGNGTMLFSDWANTYAIDAIDAVRITAKLVQPMRKAKNRL